MTGKINSEASYCIFNLFPNYLCLWEVSSGNYLCRNEKDSDYIKLLQNLKEAVLPTTLEQMKKG